MSERIAMPEIVNIKLSKLTLLENNPRKIDKTQFDKLCRSLQDDPGFLFDRPVLVHEKEDKLYVYAGNQRVRSAKKIGLTEIPCIIEKDLSDAIIKSRIVKDNAHYGEFDFDILANEYDMDMLFDAGLTADDFGLDKETVSQPEDASSDKEEEKCPICGK